MIQFARKKYLRDERILQLILLLSLLRGSPDLLFDNDSPLESYHERDLPLGSSLGHAQYSSSILAQELHPKSLDRVLASYQRSVIQDLNSLGGYFDTAVPLPGNRLNSFIYAHRDIQAYLLNAETSLESASQTSNEAGYVSGALSPEPVEEEVPQNRFSAFMPDWPRGTRFDLFEELDLLDAIWKQDVDLGVPREIFEEEDEEVTELEVASKADLGFYCDPGREKDHGEEPMGGSNTTEIPEDKPWHGMNFTIDSETGELLSNSTEEDVVSQGSHSGSSFQLEDVTSANPPLEFSLDEALKLVGLNTTSDSNLDEEPKEVKDSELDSGCGDSAASDSGGEHSVGSSVDALNALNDTLDQMIQASQLHSHHQRNFQGRLGGLGRSGSMEQRWQDLASLLSLPSPDSAHHAQSPPTPTMASHATSPIHAHAAHPPPPIHHPHAMYPNHEGTSVGVSNSPAAVPRGVLIHNATMPPPMPDAHNITYTNSMGASSHLVASSMNLTNNADIAGAPDPHHYKMETSTSLPPEMMYYQNSGPEISQTDGFLSSILNDEDLQFMDIPMTDYNGRTGGDYGGNSYRYGAPEDPHRPPVAQKKHQMFGKRFFHENPHAPQNNIGANGTGVGGGLPLVPSYPPHYAPAQGNPPMEGATAMDPSEMKYSCTMDFRPEVSAAAVEHVQNNHTYHMSPDGPSGVNRPNARDKKGRKNDIEKSMSRDEKRARQMNLPMTCEDIINLPMDEFNERISKYDLSETQLALIRDIRRRGKNKVAAQNCRKRKLDQIVHLAEEVKVIQYRKNQLHSELDHLSSEKARIKHKFTLLYKHIFQSLRDPDGNPYSPQEYSLQQSADGSILLVPRSAPPHSMDQQSHKSRHSKDDSGH